VLWLAAWLGAFFLRKRLKLHESVRGRLRARPGRRADAARLIIGFSSDGDEPLRSAPHKTTRRRSHAIGPSSARELLPAADAAKVRALLRLYCQRTCTHDRAWSGRGSTRATRAVAAEMWSAIRSPAKSEPDAREALVVSGMNDVLNSRATRRRRGGPDPHSGLDPDGGHRRVLQRAHRYRVHDFKQEGVLLMILPLSCRSLYFLIADIDRRAAA